MNPAEIPQHLPVQVAIAPDTKPYQKTHVIHTATHRNRAAQHSLSPEKLGVTGFVKDVAGFVKDLVQDYQEQKVQSVESAPQQESEQPVSKRPASPLADMATGLFPLHSTSRSERKLI